MTSPVSLRMPHFLWQELESHLFRGDGKEHGAGLAVSVLDTSRGCRLLAKKIFLAKDGEDYIETAHGGVYRLSASFVRKAVLQCKAERMSYLVIHNHGGRDSVSFSSVDMRSHERGYPALLDILDGGIVGGLVAAENAIAGDIWFSKNERRGLDRAVVIGETQTQLFPKILRSSKSSEFYDRQVRIFGEEGQQVLAEQKVGIVGLGGIGSLLNQYLSRLGVGHIVAIDADRIDVSNFSRLVGSRSRDMKRGFFKKQTHKVMIAQRVYSEGNPSGSFTPLASNVEYQHIAENLVDCDAIFLAADSMTARLVVNAICHQYLIPVWQVGTKIQNNGEVFSVSRNLIPGMSCLYCSSTLIDSGRLADEAKSSYSSSYIERVPAPSVITLNGFSASLAVNSYLAYAVANIQPKHQSDSPKPHMANPGWVKFFHNRSHYKKELATVSSDCEMCQKNLALGDTRGLAGLRL